MQWHIYCRNPSLRPANDRKHTVAAAACSSSKRHLHSPARLSKNKAHPSHLAATHDQPLPLPNQVLGSPTATARNTQHTAHRAQATQGTTSPIKPPSARAQVAVPTPSQTRTKASTVATRHSGLRAPQIVDWQIGCAAWALRSERSRRLIRRSLALLHCRNVRSARISRVMRLLSIITLRSTFRDLDRLDAWMISKITRRSCH